MKNKSLFSEFSEVSAKQWKQKIQFDLKGADYNDTLIWESLEGIHVKPFYHREDIEATPQFSLPKNHAWQIGQAIFVTDAALANKKALDILKRGASTLVFTISDAEISWDALLKEINLDKTPIHLNCTFLATHPIKSLMAYAGSPSSQIHLNIDIIGNFARTGNWFHSQEQDHYIFDEIISLCQENKGITVLGVDLGLYQNAGANMVQQLAYGLAQANEYLNYCSTHNLGLTEKPSPITFKVAVGGNYFFEIAKLKALRWLWSTLAHEYSIDEDCHILAVPSKRNKTLYDYNVNMLRTSAECMSAVLGGADTVCNQPYDALYHKDNEFAERIARNQLLLLKEESYFDEGVHAAEGTYYIETLTFQLAEKALELFKQLENAGGFLKQLKDGIIQRKTKESTKKEQLKFDSGELVLLGTNKHQNYDDKMKADLELYPFVKQEKRKTLIEPILEKRLSEAIEQKRLKDE